MPQVMEYHMVHENGRVVVVQPVPLRGYPSECEGRSELETIRNALSFDSLVRDEMERRAAEVVREFERVGCKCHISRTQYGVFERPSYTVSWHRVQAIPKTKVVCAEYGGDE